MSEITISKEIDKQIKKYLSENPIQYNFDYRESLDKHQVEKILEKGLDAFQEELEEMNMDYIWESERELFNNIINKHDELEDYDSGELRDEYLDSIEYDLNIDKLIDTSILAVIPVYSNYDCTNSFDEMGDKNDPDYLYDVYQRVKLGVKKSDMIYEHRNGAYGGSLFCFIFETSLKDLLEIKEQMKTGKQVFIPKGTQFGFFSSFQGSGSVFEKRTYRNMKLNIVDPDDSYGTIDVIGDCEQSYSFDDVYGGIDADEQNVYVT